MPSMRNKLTLLLALAFAGSVPMQSNARAASSPSYSSHYSSQSHSNESERSSPTRSPSSDRSNTSVGSSPQPSPSSRFGLSKPSSSVSEPSVNKPVLEDPSKNTGSSQTNTSSTPSRFGLSKPSTGDNSPLSTNSSNTSSSSIPVTGSSTPANKVPEQSQFGLSKPSVTSTPTVQSGQSNQTPANDNKQSGSSLFGLSKPNPQATPSVSTAVPPSVALPSMAATQGASARQVSRQMSADAARRLEEDRRRSSQPPMPVIPSQVANDANFARARNQFPTMDSYYQDRARQEPALRQSNPMAWSYAQHMRPNYGPYDSLFLSALLLNAGTSAYSAWAYSHRNDPWYDSWHRDMQAQAEQNSSLRDQLAQLDKHVKDMTEHGDAAQSTADLPPGWSTSTAISPEVFAAVDSNNEGSSSAVVVSNSSEQASPFDNVSFNHRQATKKSSHTWIWVVVALIVVCIAAFFFFKRR